MTECDLFDGMCARFSLDWKLTVLAFSEHELQNMCFYLDEGPKRVTVTIPHAHTDGSAAVWHRLQLTTTRSNVHKQAKQEPNPWSSRDWPLYLCPTIFAKFSKICAKREQWRSNNYRYVCLTRMLHSWTAQLVWVSITMKYVKRM